MKLKQKPYIAMHFNLDFCFSSTLLKADEIEYHVLLLHVLSSYLTSDIFILLNLCWKLGTSHHNFFCCFVFFSFQRKTKELEILEGLLTSKQQDIKQLEQRLEVERVNATQLVSELIRHQSQCREWLKTIEQQQQQIVQLQQTIQHFQQQIPQNVVKGQLLGKGAFGRVYKGTFAVAIKEQRPQHFAQFQHEVNMLSSCHHPNIVQFFSALDDPRQPSIYLELMDGDLKNFIRSQYHQLTQQQILVLSLDITRGLCYLHAKKVIHSDLKTDNILLKKVGPFYIAKISDLGTAVFQSDNLPINRGSLRYAAPEARTKDQQTTKVGKL